MERREPPERAGEQQAEQQSREPRWFVPARIVLGYGWVVAAVAAAAGPVAIQASRLRLEGNAAIALLAVGMLSALVFGAIGAGLIRRRPWSRITAIVVATIAVGTTIVGATFGLYAPLAVTLLFLAPSIALLSGGTRGHFARARTERDRLHVEKSLRYGLFFTVLLGIAYLAESNADDVLDAIELYQLEAECDESGTPQACAQVDLLSLQETSNRDEVIALLEQLQRQCAEHAEPIACRIWSFSRSRTLLPSIGKGMGPIVVGELESAHRLCLEGDARGCFVRAYVEVPGLDDRGVGDLVVASKKTCQKGEPLGCRAWAKYVELTLGPHSDHPELKLAREAACEHGFEQDCEALRPHDPRGIGFDVVDACNRGIGEACAAAALHPRISRVERVAYVALVSAEEQGANPGIYGAEVYETAELKRACERDVGPACLALGLVERRGESESWRPPAVDIEKFEATFGRACELGLDIACTAYGVRLLNVPLDAERNLDRANAILGVACGRGNEEACWLMNYEREILAGELEGLRAASARACRAMPISPFDTNPCDTYASLLSHELGATPWLIDDRAAFAHLRETCRTTQDPLTCARLAELLNRSRTEPLQTVLGPFYLTAWDAASISCAQDDIRGCDQMLAVTLSSSTPLPESFTEVKETLCDLAPASCQEVLDRWAQ